MKVNKLDNRYIIICTNKYGTVAKVFYSLNTYLEMKLKAEEIAKELGIYQADDVIEIQCQLEEPRLITL